MSILITYRRTLASGAVRTVTAEVPATPGQWDDVRDRSMAWALAQGRGAVKALTTHEMASEAADLAADAMAELDSEWARNARETARAVAQAVLSQKGTRTADRARHAISALAGRGKLIR